MNTYREPVDFIEMVDKHLLYLLSGELSRETIVSQAREAILDQERGLKIVGNENLTAIGQKILQAIDYLVSYTSFVSGKTVFLNTNSFNRKFLNMYRLLTLLKYGFILPTNEITRKQFEDVWEKVQVTLLENMPIRLLTKPLVANIECLIQLR